MAWGVFRVPVVGYGWVRLLALVGAVATLGLLHVPFLRPSSWDWLVALVSAVGVLAGGRLPLSVLLAQCGLLVAGSVVASIGVSVVRIFASISLGEVALRRPGWPCWVGAAGLALAGAASPYPLYSTVANMVIVLVDVGVPLLLGSFVRDQRERASQAERRMLDAQRRSAWQVSAARAAERGAIARELHDVVAHHVASIVLRSAVARHVVGDGDPRLLEALADVHEIGAQALADLRGLVSLLRAPGAVEDGGLLAANDLCAALTGVLDRTRQAGISLTADIDPEALATLDTVHRHAVLRVVQEGLTNVLKHAGPGASAHVAIQRRADGALRLEITDSGGDDHTPLVGAEPGHGLMLMRERVELLGGHLHAGPSGPGWTLQAHLPNITVGELAGATP